MGLFTFFKNQHSDEECPCCNRVVELEIKGKCFEEKMPDYFTNKYSIFGLFQCDYCKQQISVLFHKNLNQVKLGVYSEDEINHEMDEVLAKLQGEIELAEELITDNPSIKKHKTYLSRLEKKYEATEEKYSRKVEKVGFKCEKVSERLMYRNNPPNNQMVTIIGDVNRIES